MPKQNQNNLHFGDTGDHITDHLSMNLLNALTQQEIAQLIEVLFGVLSPELQAQAIAQLSPDTQQTVQQILAPPSTVQPTQVSVTQTTSLAKQAQTWSELWQDWQAIVEEAGDEAGRYIVQEAHWEPPYFDATTFSEDLEKIAAQMQPLLLTAFEHQFTPNRGFATALLAAESAVSNGLEDWMELTDGLCLEHHLTHCLLQWELLTAQQQGQNVFQFAQRLRECELQFQEIELDSDTVLDFFTQWPEAENRCILAGLTAVREASFWQRTLGDIHSHWHHLYLYLIEQYEPDRYLENLRKTIPQQWQNGLPIIEAALNQQNYTESLTVIQETLSVLLKSKRGEANWVPEAALLIAVLGFYYEGERENVRELLHSYQQTAQGLNQSERANALKIQQIALTQWFDWSAMFTAFDEIPLSASTRQALFTSWRNYVDRHSKPQTWGGYGSARTVDGWWVPWLIESIADSQKGAHWFQQQITQWITNLSGDKAQLGENYDLLRLLTKDLTEIQNREQSSYPQFYQTVIHTETFSTQTNQARRDYLRQYAPVDLWDRVMNYWKTHLHHFVPKPESAHKSDYTEHVRWMIALKELSPQSYETLLAQWRTAHQRRSNLWKAMQQMGLIHD